jgi:CheY-like chemotaxis protein
VSAWSTKSVVTSKEARRTGAVLGIRVIEENRVVRDLLHREFEARGCHVTATNHGVEGLQAIVLGRFDAVVRDVVMLPRGGLWLWREATTLRPEPRGRFIFWSTNGAPDSAAASTRTERCLAKPLDLDTLWAEILALTTPPEA